MEREKAIYKAAFNAIYRKGCTDRGDWIDAIIDYYPDEVVVIRLRRKGVWKTCGMRWIIQILGQEYVCCIESGPNILAMNLVI